MRISRDGVLVLKEVATVCMYKPDGLDNTAA
jgi:hypothetical protein